MIKPLPPSALTTNKPIREKINRLPTPEEEKRWLERKKHQSVVYVLGFTGALGKTIAHFREDEKYRVLYIYHVSKWITVSRIDLWELGVLLDSKHTEGYDNA